MSHTGHWLLSAGHVICGFTEGCDSAMGDAGEYFVSVGQCDFLEKWDIFHN